MKVWLAFFVLAIGCFSSLAAQKITTAVIGGKELTGISSVKVLKQGNLFIMHANGGLTAAPDQLPAGFLESWGITEDNFREVKETAKRESEADFLKAVAAGMFRDVGGIVYDTRKGESGWVRLTNVKLLQMVEDGAIVDASPGEATLAAIFVRNLTPTVGDTDVVSVLAKLTGSYSYINRLGDPRTIRAYDCGIPCGLSQIPDAIAQEGKVWAKAIEAVSDTRRTLAKLPVSTELSSSGTGFFITEDGYLLTNSHVVDGASQLKVRTSEKVLEARLVIKDKHRDLALLKVEGRFTPLCISEQASASLGSAVFTVGFPNILLQGLEPKYTDGKISSLSGMHDNPDLFQISVPVQPGNSGGPLLDDKGRVVGVVVARLSDFAGLRVTGSLPQNVNYAIKNRVVREFLSKVPEVQLFKGAPETSGEQAVLNATKAVGVVLAY